MALEIRICKHLPDLKLEPHPLAACLKTYFALLDTQFSYKSPKIKSKQIAVIFEVMFTELDKNS